MADYENSSGTTVPPLSSVTTSQSNVGRLRSAWTTLKQVLYGMSVHDMARQAHRTRASLEHLFLLITLGDLVGLPILPPYYSLRLLPFIVPEINAWKRRLLREKDIMDVIF